MSAIVGFILSSLSGLLLYASFPTLGMSFLAWFALVPFFIVLLRSRPFIGFLWSFIFVVVFYTGFFIWIFDLSKYNLLHHAILWVYLGPLTGLFGIALSYTAKRRGQAAALLAAPFFWVIVEYVRSNLSFLALPWALLAHTQYQHPVIIQIASVFGTYGVSFLIVLVNSAVTAIVIAVANRVKFLKPPFYQSLSNRGLGVILGAAGVCVALALVYGYMIVNQTVAGTPIKLAVVQGNIEQNKKWDRNYYKFIMQTYRNLTLSAASKRPTMIVWPETATPGSISRHLGMYHQLKLIATEADAYLLFGSAQGAKFAKKETDKSKYVNSAFLIPPGKKKEKTQRYDKIRLLPFGEYLPHKETIPWSYLKVPDVGNYIPGNEYTVFDHPKFRFSVTICWENLFPGHVREFVKNGAQFIINLTNEAWFGKTAAPYQFLSMSVFRAVENRIYIVRCANTGVSCIIDSNGRILDRVKDENGKDIFIRGILSGEVATREAQTIYTHYGDWFAWFSAISAFAFILFALIRKNPTGV